jgi:hypothetical protein
MRTPVIIACLLGAAACSLAPQLSPRAVGCYAVQLDSFPADFQRMQVPAPPALVRMDTVHGGQLQVPTAWLEQQGPAMRSAWLGLMRPGWRIEGGKLRLVQVAQSQLPPDSVTVTFGGSPGALAASLGADSTGNWSGWAFAMESALQGSATIVPIRLLRRECGAVPLGVSRY